MLRKFKYNRRGFTLIELLMIVALLAILGMAALSSFVDTSGSFRFLQKYNELASTVRGVRSLAVTNALGAERIGLKISKDGYIYTIEGFADNGTTPLSLDAGDKKILDLYHKIGEPFEIDVQNVSGNANGNDFPIYIFYEIGGQDVSVSANGAAVEAGAVSLKFSDTNNGFDKYLVIFQVSGLIEEFGEPPL